MLRWLKTVVVSVQGKRLGLIGSGGGREDVPEALDPRVGSVGNSATLYRNVAHRRQLLEALYIDEIDAVCEATTTIGGDTPGEIFTTWLRRFFAYFTSKRFVAAELLQHTDKDDPFFGAGLARVLDASRPLLLAGQKSGEIQVDLTLEQILNMVSAIATRFQETPITASRS